MAFLRCDIRSNVLEQDTSLTVLLPYDRPAQNQQTPCRVLYLYHGIKLNDTGWLRKTGIESYAEQYGLAVIMPDCSRGFATDGLYTPRYYTYLAEELPALCGKLFGISQKREDTFAAGLSMGGYAALKVALRNPTRFWAAAGLSPTCNPLEFALSPQAGDQTNRETAAIWGSPAQLQQQDDLWQLATQAAQLPQVRRPKLYMACGLQDFLLDQNHRLRRHIKTLPLDFTYEEWEGAHDWPFWDAAIQRGLACLLGKPV